MRSPIVQALVTAKVTPAAVMAFTKPVSRVSESTRRGIQDQLMDYYRGSVVRDVNHRSRNKKRRAYVRGEARGGRKKRIGKNLPRVRRTRSLKEVSGRMPGR